MGTNLSHALDLAARGLRVFPLVENGKTPAFAGWQAAATTDPETLTAWFTGEHRRANVGVATGHGLMVVDADVKNGNGLASLDLMAMLGADLDFVVATAGGGRHAYFRLPDGAAVASSTRRLADYPHVDIRGEGGLAVAPGSTIDGRPYKLIADRPIPEAPSWLVEAAQRARKVRERSDAVDAELDRPDAIARARLYLEQNAPEAIEGAGGNDTTYRIAAHVRDYGLSESATLDAMLAHWNERKASPPWDPEELERIVEHAFEYATGGAGGKSAEAEFDAVEIETDGKREREQPAKKRGLFRVDFDTAAAFATTQVNPALVEDIVDQHSFAVFYGPSNSGKTFLALSLAYHIAQGLPWAGHEVAKGAVLYVVAEGGRGINKRIAALKQHYKPATRPPFDIVPCPVDLRSNDADVRRIVKLARECAEEHGEPLRLIVVDTLSRALAGGDENASTDMGAFIANIDRLREATSATVLVVHHTGKNIANGARGWSGLRAAIDTEVEIKEGGTISFEKQRDLEKIPDIRFRLEVVNLGAGPAGKDVTSCILHPMTTAEAEFEAQMDLPPLAKDYFDVLVDLAGPDSKSITTADWSRAFDEFMVAGQQPRLGDKTLQRLRSTLVESGWVERVDNSRWKPVSR